LDQRLERRTDGLCAALNSEGIISDISQLQEEVTEVSMQMPSGSVIQIRTLSGEVVTLSTEDWPMPPGEPAKPVFSTIEKNGRRFRTLSKQAYCSGQSLTILTADPTDQIEEVTGTFQTILLTMIPGVLLVACLGGLWISRRALAPVNDITNVARSITLQNLSKRLAVPQTGDELQKMSETWNEVLARLEDAAGRIQQFTADASHELRTPVALIRATAELALRRERAPEQYRQSLCEILSESERMTNLTNDLLLMASADADSLDMPLAPVDLNRVISETVQTSAALAANREIRLKMEVPSESNFVPANEPGLKRLLLILIDNALKFTPAEGTVIVSAARDKTGVTVSVKDSGPGIPTEVIPHIFERFYRADPSHNRNEGAGLGLSIAQIIAAAHESSIQVERIPDSGSRFSFTLKL